MLLLLTTGVPKLLPFLRRLMSIHVEVLHALTAGKQKEITAMQHNPFVVVVALLL